MKKKSSLFIKILVIGIIALILFAGWLFDFIRAKQFDVDIIYVSNSTPYASEQDKVSFTVLVTQNGKPCVDHEVEVRLGENQGRFSAYLKTTDENGCVSFEYVPYYESDYVKAGPVTITVLELSNSIFVEVNVVKQFNVIEVKSLG